MFSSPPSKIVRSRMPVSPLAFPVRIAVSESIRPLRLGFLESVFRAYNTREPSPDGPLRGAQHWLALPAQYGMRLFQSEAQTFALQSVVVKIYFYSCQRSVVFYVPIECWQQTQIIKHRGS